MTKERDDILPLEFRWPLSRRAFLGLGAFSVAGLVAPGIGRAEPPPSPVPSAKPGPMTEPLRLIALARSAYAKVDDYTCTLVKREVLDGKLSSQAVIALRVRKSPLSVHLRWQEPSDLKGQEAFYVAGKHDGKMRVRPPGLLAAVGYVLLDPDDPQAKKTSRHSITEAGLGSLIERFSKGWEAEAKLNATEVRIGVYELGKRRCTRVETIHPTNPDKAFLYHRSVVYFDKEHHLPVRVEGYDWPKKAGEPAELLEVHTFFNLRTNVGLKEDAFGG